MIFAWGQVALSVAASVVYAVRGDWKHAVYWVAAAILVTCVNLMK